MEHTTTQEFVCEDCGNTSVVEDQICPNCGGRMSSLDDTKPSKKKAADDDLDLTGDDIADDGEGSELSLEQLQAEEAEDDEPYFNADDEE